MQRETETSSETETASDTTVAPCEVSYDVEVGTCPDSLAVCGAPDDLAVLDECCGWSL